MGERGGDARPVGERAQFVLAAAALVAVALAPAVLAYLQLAYHADLAASGDRHDRAGEGVRVLERAVHEADREVRGSYRWGRRREAVEGVRAALRPSLRTLEASAVEAGVAYRTEYDRAAARSWTADPANCPSGRGRQFGPCRARRGVVVQERAGETHLVAVAFELRVTAPREEIRLTVVVRAVGGAASG